MSDLAEKLLQLAAASEWRGFAEVVSEFKGPGQALIALCEELDGDTDVQTALAAGQKLLDMPGVLDCVTPARTALHCLCTRDDISADLCVKMVELLVRGGMEPNSLDSRGESALHCLCAAELPGSLAVAAAHALLDNGASCTLEDAEGRTPFSIASGSQANASAERPCQPELAELLRRRVILSHHGCGHKVIIGASGGTQVVAGDEPIAQTTSARAIVMPMPEPAPENETPQLQVLVIDPSSSLRRDPRRFCLAQQHFLLEFPEMPEPFDDLAACVEVVKATLEAAASNFNVLMATSWGASVVAAVIEQGAWQGPTLLLGGAGTLDCMAKFVDEGDGSIEYFNVPICLYHGSQDELHPILDVRTQATAACRSVMLIEAENDDHTLQSLSADNGKMLVTLLLQVVQWGAEMRASSGMSLLNGVSEEEQKVAEQRLLSRYVQLKQMDTFVQRLRQFQGEQQELVGDSDGEWD